MKINTISQMYLHKNRRGTNQPLIYDTQPNSMGVQVDYLPLLNRTCPVGDKLKIKRLY